MQLQEWRSLWLNRLHSNGQFKADTRFTVEFTIPVKLSEARPETEGFIRVTYSGQDRPKIFTTTVSQDALNWMVAQPPPTGSLRLGNVVSAATSALGITACAPCRQRQLYLNSIGARK